LLSRYLNGNARGAPSSLDGAPWASQSTNNQHLGPWSRA
jgi:hypothetical protein